MAMLTETERWSQARLRQYQAEKLNAMLVHSYANVPFYRESFDKHGYDPRTFSRLEDLRRLPLLTRDEVRVNTEKLIARNYPKSKLQHETTSGSSGNPLGFYFERGLTDEIERAFIHTLWRRVGFNPGTRCAVFRGKVLRTAAKGRFWDYDPLEKNLYFSNYHMTDDILATYVNKIRGFNPRFICGYPSALLAVAQYMTRHQIEPFEGVRAVLCGSENLFPGLRETLREAFRCRIFSWYGHTERAALAGECECSQEYHIFPEYGIVELIRPNGDIIETPNEIGEIVATGLHNLVFPMIRYRTSDMAAYSERHCACGRQHRLLSGVEGRAQEFIVTRDGRTVNLTAFATAHHFKAFARMRQMQFVQEKAGAITIRIVRLPEFSSDDEALIRKVMLNAVDGELDIDFSYVDDIPRTQNGKHSFLIQRLPAITEECHVG
jgi:phenylacetate-CoA ligase